MNQTKVHGHEQPTVQKNQPPEEFPPLSATQTTPSTSATPPRLSYAATAAKTITKNLYKIPSNPLHQTTDNSGHFFRSINPGAVVFSFSDFAPLSRTDMEEALVSIFDQYKPTSIRGHRRVGNKQDAVEIVFVPHLAATLRQQATEIGVQFRNASVKAVTAHSLKNNYTYIKLRQLPLYPSEEEIVRVLRQSMGAFGKVVNVSIIKSPIGNGKYHSYSGDGFVLLDTSTGPNQMRYRALKPFIMIPEWSTTIRALWKDSPPACSYCKETGHIFQDCPIKANAAIGLQTCFLCKQPGHIRRDCPEGSLKPTPTNKEELSEETSNNVPMKATSNVAAISVPTITQEEPINTSSHQMEGMEKEEDDNKLTDIDEDDDSEDSDYSDTAGVSQSDSDMDTDPHPNDSEDPNYTANDIPEEEAEDLYYQQMLYHPKSTSSYDSIHAQAQLRTLRSHFTQNTQSTSSNVPMNSSQTVIPDSLEEQL